jgi:hypothetical protein
MPAQIAGIFVFVGANAVKHFGRLFIILKESTGAG